MRLELFLLSVTVLHCAAGQSRIALPPLGYAYDSATLAIRAIRGTAGASLLAEPLQLPFDVEAVAISPSRDFALAVSAATHTVNIIRWQTEIASVNVPDVMDAPDRLILSGSGAAAILYNSASGGLQVLTGLPATPVVHQIQTWREARAFAVTNDGAVAVAAADKVHFVAPDLNSFSLPLSATVAALAFDNSGTQLLAVTTSGDVYLASNVLNGSDVRSVYTGTEQTSNPVAVRFLADSGAALTASTAGVIAVIDMATGTAATLNCQCAPTGLEPFGRAGLFQLTDISTRPVLFFDSAPTRRRLWFVPADERSAQ